MIQELYHINIEGKWYHVWADIESEAREMIEAYIQKEREQMYEQN